MSGQESTKSYEIDGKVEVYPAGEEVMVVQVDRDEIHRLNRTAGLILDLCKGRSAEELVHEMQALYPGVAAEDLRTDVEETLADLVEKGVLRISAEVPGTPPAE